MLLIFGNHLVDVPSNITRYFHRIHRNPNLYSPLRMPAVFVVVRRNLYNFGVPIWYLLYLEMNTFANQFVISYIFIKCTSTVGMFKGICRFHRIDNITFILFTTTNCADYLNNCVVIAVWRIVCAMWSSEILLILCTHVLREKRSA